MAHFIMATAGLPCRALIPKLADKDLGPGLIAAMLAQIGLTLDDI